MTSTTSAKTIAALRHLFAAYGLPEQVVTDNGPQFTSDEFQAFMLNNAIQHTRCAPYHPASNGLAERFVQTFKHAMKASEKQAHSLSHCLANFLLTYRSTLIQQLVLPPASFSCNETFVPVLIYFDQTMREKYVRNKPNKLHITTNMQR